MEDIIIVGAGPIGIYAATLASLHNLKGLVFESQSNVGGQLSSLYPEKDIVDLPGFNKITAQGFIDELYNQYNSKANKLEIHLEESISSFEKKDDFYVVTTNQGVYETKTILLTTGMGNFTPRKTGCSNEDDFKNIYYSIKNKAMFEGKKVAVLGGGDSAVDWTLMLEPLCSDISIVHRRNEFRAQALSVEEMKKTKTNVLTPYTVKALNGENGILKSVTLEHVDTKEEKTIEVDYLIVNYGLIPSQNTFNIEKTGNNINVFDAYMTSSENVFAIGNAINYPGKVKNITCGLGEAVVAITKIDQIINPNKNIPVHF